MVMRDGAAMSCACKQAYWYVRVGARAPRCLMELQPRKTTQIEQIWSLQPSTHDVVIHAKDKHAVHDIRGSLGRISARACAARSRLTTLWGLHHLPLDVGDVAVVAVGLVGFRPLGIRLRILGPVAEAVWVPRSLCMKSREWTLASCQCRSILQIP